MNKAEIIKVEKTQAGELKMRVKQILMIGLSGFFLAACEGDKSSTLQDSLTIDNTVDTISNLDFGNSVIPFPNNVLFAGTADLTLNIPVADATNLADPSVALNALDGFSTVAPISTGFTGALDDTSFPAGVKLYEATAVNGIAPVISVQSELTFGVDFVTALSSVDSTNSTLVIVPIKPLKPKQTYLVVVTNAVKSASGKAVGISPSYTLTHGTNPLVDGTGASLLLC